jgi:hypothetical protein
MRVALIALAVLAIAGFAGTASAHYLIEQDTPAGHVCALNLELIRDGVLAQDTDLILEGVYTEECE